MIRQFEVDGPAFIKRQQGRLRDRIGAVVLFEHIEQVFARGIAQDHRIRLHVRGDVVDLDLVLARLEIEWQILSHHGKILVIDGE